MARDRARRGLRRRRAAVTRGQRRQLQGRCSLPPYGGGDLQCIEESVLGYGVAPSSNIFQRLGWVFRSIIVDRFEAGGTALLALSAARDELGARIVAYVAVRTALSAETGRNELRFCTPAPHTDNFRVATVGIDHTLRLVSC